MVFCGKPSKSCQPCRSKRRKCDLARPSCRQCLRANTICSGYRDVVMLSFRDETATIRRKAQRSNDERPDVERECSNTPEAALQFHEENGNMVIRSSPVLEIDIIALTHFLDLYVPDTVFAYLPQHWLDLQVDNTVRPAVLTVATAALAWSSKQPKLLAQARSHYTTALRVTNGALGHSNSATLNSTLLNVLLLAMYEAIIFKGRIAPEPLAAHINGLLALLAMRNSAECDELGQKLNRHASNQILAHCARRDIPVPEFIKPLMQRGVSDRTGDSLQVMGTLLERVATLSANMRGMLATDVVRECLQLDRIAQEAMTDLHTSSPYRTVANHDNGRRTNVMGKQIHIYQSQNAVRQWNNLRALRLAFNEWIFCAYDPELRGIITDFPTMNDPLYDGWDDLPRVARMDFEVILESILASVPYSRGYFDKSRGVSARFLLWPLGTAAVSELCPPAAKTLIIAILRDIGVEHGIEQAEEAATMLEENVPTEDWLHIYQFS